MLRTTIAMVAMVGALAVMAEEAAPVITELGGDTFAAGATVRVAKTVSGDLVAAGGSVDVDAPVGGDTVIAGGNVQIDAALGGSVYAGGGRILVNDTVTRNVRVAGGQVELGKRAVVGGNLSAAGGHVSVLGTVKGHVQAAAGRVYVNGAVEGDVVAIAGSMELGPNARIAGRVRYTGRDEVRRDPAATVVGGIAHTRWAGPPDHHPHRSPIGSAFAWIWSAGLIVLAAILAGAAPSLLRRVVDTVRTRWPTSLAVGFASIVCIPLAALVLIATLIGAPLGLLALFAYPPLLVAGYVATGAAIGWIALKPARASWRVAAAALGMLVVTAAAKIPWFGALVLFLALILGVGALVMQLRRNPALA